MNEQIENHHHHQQQQHYVADWSPAMPDFVMPNPNPNLLRLPIDGQLERSVTRPKDVDT